ncbi:hypothetical protein [Myxococcus sp. SDU36]|uniref:hypothetical protein n=1 Tax=Myxococcus sp. SDU36 TaxID=2831967 RepID=UPI002542CA55|nr:hypothetical protein [Myxococcus sp. SDU36]WIG98707.1 hypothetical protein KGD87_15685 [Myxococcus sp. SDU36]
MKITLNRITPQKNTITTTALVFLFGCGVFAPEAEAQTSPSFTYLSNSAKAKTTRYWDCCKASGAFDGKAEVNAPVKACARDGKTPVDAATQSICSGGTGFTCTSNQPWPVNKKLSYGFAAASLAGKSESDTSCACYELKFTSGSVKGKTFVAQVINSTMSSDPDSNHFSLMIPGGGVGIFNGCQSQWNAPSEGWGARYGGVSNSSQCSQLPAELRQGCNWRFGWFKNAKNPNTTFRRVKCPTELIAKSGCTRKDE